MKSDGSMFLPPTFSSGPLQLDPIAQTPRAVSPVPSCVSMKSDWSMFLPPHFSREPPQSDPNVFRNSLTQDQCWCGVCEQLLRDPVITTCGHSFCRQCISSYWSQSAPSGDYSCPQCRKRCRTQPFINPDTTMTQPVLHQHGTTAQFHLYPYTTLAQPTLYPSAAMAQPTLYPSAAMAELSLSHHRQMAQPHLNTSTSMAQGSPYPHTYMEQLPLYSVMGQHPLYPHIRMAQTSLQPPVAERTAGSNHLQTEHAPFKSAKRTGNYVLNSVLMSHKASMKRRFESISEGIIRPGAQTLLNKIYTELYITEGESEGVNNEHEVWQVESASRPQTTEDTAINCNDIFKPLPGQERHIRTVMTKGIAGIGKTVSVQKFILDWAEEKANQDVDFMFVLPFRELNLVKDVEYSLHRLLLDFHPELRELENSEYRDCNMVFIFDGLDESRLPLNFQENQKLSDVTQMSPVDVLMTSLIQGTLLPSALIWVTSRPAATSQIPSQCVNLVTEVRGFSDPQKEEYFRKRIIDQKQANRIITHIKATRSLHIMCHMPVFCWIAATVLQLILEQDDGKEVPKTLTEMFIHFLLIQTTRKNQKYQEETEADRQRLLASHKGVILKLAELAFRHLENGNLMFYEEDLRECGIDISEASVYSGMCTEIFREECVFDHNKVYCFVHLSIQEFLAALYVFASYLGKNMEAIRPFVPLDALPKSAVKKGLGNNRRCIRLILRQMSRSLQNVPLDELLKGAVNKALESKNGHLDLFVRFLHGISLESNQRLLLGLLTHTHSSPESVKETIKNLKVMQRPNISPERCINLFHCLVEMHDSSVHDEIQAFLKEEKGSIQQLSLAHCSALAHVLLMSDEVLDEFDLKKYKTSPEGHNRLVPAVRCCRKALLAGCKLTEKSCETVASALQSANSPLRELDLTHNDLQKSGEKLLDALQSPHCKLETLRLAGCKLTDESYKVLASAVQSAVSLTELDVGDNHMSVYAVQLLKTALLHTNCKLQTLRLSPNHISGDGCVCLAVTLMLNPSCATRLDLSNSPPEGPAQELLLDTWRNSDHQVESLRLAGCKLTDKSCEVVADALQSANPLLELDLSDNELGDSGVEFLSKGLSSPHCKLQILRLSPNHISGDGCVCLAVTLMLNPSCATRLDLSNSPPEGPAQELLLDTWRNSDHQVESLRLAGCKLTDKSCEVVADALQSANPLLELDLSDNELGDSGVEFLSKGLSSPHCKLQILRLVIFLKVHCASLTLCLGGHTA
ncbi:hypothetical protein ACEWY4_017420 [Coilia grayii]|uniref:NACHT, LRR and PYD domains-containing protein 12-like n=1 Tax=Coilia grayii TaxID=363190 RepID=A0ABD1JJL6_9TELE